jgi:hypothetical protein
MQGDDCVQPRSELNEGLPLLHSSGRLTAEDFTLSSAHPTSFQRTETIPFDEEGMAQEGPEHSRHSRRSFQRTPSLSSDEESQVNAVAVRINVDPEQLRQEILLESERNSLVLDANNSGAAVSASYPETRRSNVGIRKVTFCNEIQYITLKVDDNNITVDIHYTRNLIGYVNAFVLVVVFLFFDAFQFDIIPSGSAPVNMLFAWASFQKVFMYLAVLFAFKTGLRDRFWSGMGFTIIRAKPKEFGVPLLFLGITYSAWQFLRLLGLSYAPDYVPIYGPSLASVLLWVLCFRSMCNALVFVSEYLLAFALMIFTCLASMPMFFPHPHAIDTFKGNAVQLASAIFFGFMLLLLERTATLTDGLAVRFSVFVFFSPFWNCLLTWQQGQWRSFAEWFQGYNFVCSLTLAATESAVQLQFLAMVRHLDVLSIGAVFTGKSLILPYLNLALETKKNVMWGRWFQVCSGVALIICLLLVYRASRHRQTYVAMIRKEKIFGTVQEG